MLLNFIGAVDWAPAFVLMTFFAMISIISTASIAKHKDRQELADKVELERLRLNNAKEIDLTKIRNQQEYQFKQLDQGLITSHREED